MTRQSNWMITTLSLVAALAAAPAAEAQMAAPAPPPAVHSPALGGGMMGMSGGMNRGSTMRDPGHTPGMSGGTMPSASDCQRMMQSGGASADMQERCRAAMASPPLGGGSSSTGQGGH